MSEAEIVEKYFLLRPQYVAFTERTLSLIDELLKINWIKFHLIEGRAKTVDSFKEKIRRPGKSYINPIEELPDLSGIRVIVYYLDDVDTVANILSNEFTIIESEISHQASEYSVDQFGYISLHFVVSLNPDRSDLPEWKTYESFRAEIQIRTVLQHSWAAVSHALQYKHESDVPKQLRRKLYRLAGLFELADEEFISVRDSTESIRKTTIQELDQGNIEIQLNSISLNEFMQRWDRLHELRDLMQSLGYIFEQISFEDDDEDTDDLGKIAAHCEKLNILTIQEFESTVNYDPESFLGKINPGEQWYVSDEFALYLLLIGARPEEFTVDDLVQVGWGESIAARVIEVALEEKS